MCLCARLFARDAGVCVCTAEFYITNSMIDLNLEPGEALKWKVLNNGIQSGIYFVMI